MRNIQIPEIENSTQIHLRIGMGLLCNVQAKASHKGLLKK
jgi:hypothetical protein